MPSSSKAQAAFFRAAAHSPEIREKTGLTEAQAREWMAEDQKEGEKNLPEHSHARQKMAKNLRGEP